MTKLEEHHICQLMDESDNLRQLNFSLLQQIAGLQQQVSYYEGEVTRLRSQIHRTATLDFFKQETLHIEMELQAALTRNELLEEELSSKARPPTKTRAKTKLKQSKHSKSLQTDASTQTESSTCNEIGICTAQSTSWWGYYDMNKAWADQDSDS